jgi:DNA-binding NarL/FixJ family response regulator
MRPKVAIVDDQPLMRAAYRTILENADIELVGEAGDGEGAVMLCQSARPDVVLMDVRMPGRDGIAATQMLTESQSVTRVLVLTTFDDDDVLYGALAAGAAGFLLKNSPPEALVRAVFTVAAGDSVLDPSVAGRVFARVAHHPQRADGSALIRLTEREKDVLRLLCLGLTNGEIAQQLGVGDATSKSHVSSVLTKLGVRDRVQAVIYAYETGFAR